MHDAGVLHLEMARQGVPVVSVSVGPARTEVPEPDKSQWEQVGDRWVRIDFDRSPSQALKKKVRDFLAAAGGLKSTRSRVRIVHPAADADLEPRVEFHQPARMLGPDEVAALLQRLAAMFPEAQVSWEDAE